MQVAVKRLGALNDVSDWRQGSLPEPRGGDYREYQHPIFRGRIREILPAASWLQRHDRDGSVLKRGQYRATQGYQRPRDLAHPFLSGERLERSEHRLEDPVQRKHDQDAERRSFRGRRSIQGPATDS